MITERQVIKSKTVINALVKEALVKAALSLVLLMMPIANRLLLMRNGGKSNHSPDWNRVGTVLKCLCSVSLGWYAKDNNAKFGRNVADIQGYQLWSVLAICYT